MKFDMTDQYLPWRYYIGECLQSGALPLWNPYVHLGYPIHADPQSGAWYPIVWLIGGFLGYSIYWIQLEFLLHVFLAGVGMYLLAKLFVNEKRIALTAALCFMLCGFFSGNAQHLTWIVSGAWIPFVLYYFVKFQQQGSRNDLIKIALAFFMLITGGYPAFGIVTAYSLMLMSLVHLWRIKAEKEKFVNTFKQYLFLMILILLTNAVSIASLITNSESSVRSVPQSLSFVMSNPFSPQALLSWLFPLASVKNPELFNTDISMSNGYIGLLGLSGLLFFMWKCRRRKDILLFVVAVCFLLVAFGDATPLRGWLYHVPLFDRFRFPSLFRLFALMLFVVCAGIGWAKILSDKLNKKTVIVTLSLIAFLLVGGIVYSLSHVTLANIKPDLFSWNSFINSLNFDESIFLQGTFQVLFLIVMIILFISTRNFIKLLSWLAAFNLCASTLIINPVTVINDESPKELNAKIGELPKGFPIPLLKPMEQFKDRENSIGQFWLNLGIWNKQPYWQGYNSYQSPKYNLFEDSPQAKYVLKNPLLYFSSSASIYKDTITDTTAIANHPTHLYLSDETDLPMEAMQEDTSTQLQIISFAPNQIRVSTHTSQKQWLTLLQQHVNGWEVDVDGAEVKTYTSNYLFVSSIIPKGNHQVLFKYHNNAVVISFWISIISLLLSIILMFKNKEVKT